MDVMEAIYHRRAVRRFTAAPVNAEALRSLIEAAIQAKRDQLATMAIRRRASARDVATNCRGREGPPVVIHAAGITIPALSQHAGGCRLRYSARRTRAGGDLRHRCRTAGGGRLRSGSAEFDARGTCARPWVGIGFAIPSDVIQTIASQLEATGHVVRGFIGVQTQAINQALAKALRLPDRSGALVAGVEANSPAAQGGMEVGDVIGAVNGQPVATPRDLAVTIAAVPPGSQARWPPSATAVNRVLL